jgi:hypothetical protein
VPQRNLAVRVPLLRGGAVVDPTLMRPESREATAGVLALLDAWARSRSMIGPPPDLTLSAMEIRRSNRYNLTRQIDLQGPRAIPNIRETANGGYTDGALQIDIASAILPSIV